MRRSLGLLAVVALFVPALAVLASTENVRDDFVAVSYAGNDGSIDWGGPWIEIGESDGAGSGQVRVADQQCSNNRCLRMSGGLLGEIAIRRGVGLERFSGATLHFDLYVDAALLSAGSLYVEATKNGSAWTTLKSYQLVLQEGQHSESLDVSAYASADFGLRFRLTGLLGGDTVYIDRVNIEGPVQATTTSTSTTSTSSTTSTTSSASSNDPTSTTTTTARSSAPPGVSSTSTTTPTRAGSEGEDVTTTTDAGTTSTTGEALVTRPPNLPPFDSGIRRVSVGLMADYQSGMAGDLDTAGVEVLGAEVEADFSLAVEVFEVTKVWIALLTLLIAAAIVGGMDRWRGGIDH